MVAILLGNGFEEAEALVPADLLRRAGVRVALVSLEGETATGSHDITVKTDLSLAALSPEEVELVLLPGGMGGVNAMGADPRVAQLVRVVLDRGSYVAAICAAPTLLGKWGLLKGKRAVCYPGMEGEVTGAQMVPSIPYVVDGQIITGEAPGAAFPFGLKLVELLKGGQVAQEVRNALHYHG